ncbi:MAG: RNA polymerase sigma factor SigA [bacterium ADurb.Bin212]|nr:MAG: RNA polymerase sigma factor SigA [bacterium ADurb.Bin212]
MEKIDFSPYSIIKDGLKKLKDKESKVVTERFGLGTKKKTLAAIGGDLDLSRERIRQIEKDALKKLSLYLVSSHNEKTKKLLNILESESGILHKKSAEKMLLKDSANENDTNALNLIMSIMSEVEEIERDDHIHDSWILATIPRKEVASILKEWADYLNKNNTPAKIDVLLEAHPHHLKHKISFLSALPKVSKKIIQNYQGDLGLSSWPEFNPKNVRDKIYYVLRKNQAPMHFAEIGRAIQNENFDGKKVVLATIHNELIADPRFILIGRGIYALSEWGYQSGTVRDIIRAVLKKASGAMTLADITKEVSKQRHVRKNTILINLQTNKEFKKLSTDKYILSDQQ